MEFSRSLDRFIQKDLKWKDAMVAAFRKNNIALNETLLENMKILHEEQFEAEEAKSDVHKAFEKSLADHEASVAENLNHLEEAVKSKIAAIMADDNLSEEQKRRMIRSARSMKANMEAQIKNGYGDQAGMAAKMKQELAKFQQLVDRATGVASHANDEFKEMNVDDHLDGLKKKVDVLKNTKIFSPAQLLAKKFANNDQGDYDAVLHPEKILGMTRGSIPVATDAHSQAVQQALIQLADS